MSSMDTFTNAVWTTSCMTDVALAKALMLSLQSEPENIDFGEKWKVDRGEIK